jgi:hypothetical protein
MFLAVFTSMVVKLTSSTNNLLGWVLPPLVICAVEAHAVSPCFVHY